MQRCTKCQEEFEIDRAIHKSGRPTTQITTTRFCPFCAFDLTEGVGEQPRRRKPGGGRKPKHGKAMVQLQARVPPAIRAQLIDEFGSVQAAVNALIIEPRLTREQKNNDQ